MNKLIEFKENGFIYDGNFYTYKNIFSINKIKYITDDDYCNIRLGLCTEENATAYKEQYFKIQLTNNKSIFIGYKYSTNLYEKFERTNKFMKFLLGDKFIKNRKLNEFYSTETEQMKKDLENLKTVRNELIEKFNTWKGK